MCPVAAESKDSKPSSKKKINKKINTNPGIVVEEDSNKNSQNLHSSSDLNESNTENKNEFSDSEEEDKGLGNIKLGPKGIYTEDSIRVYLQEIGRIRLLRPDEEIELARKIADLLQLEELATQFESDDVCKLWLLILLSSSITVSNFVLIFLLIFFFELGLEFFDSAATGHMIDSFLR